MSTFKDIQQGAMAGLAATVPMTLAMVKLHDELPFLERYPLPPRQITMNLARKAGIKQNLDAREKFTATMLAHFAVGTTAGAIYGPLARQLPLPPPVSGALFGLAVWSGNYLGVLPALDLLPPATRHPVRRTALMIAAHLVWGTATGMLVARLSREKARRRSRHTEAPVSAAAQWNDRAEKLSPLPGHPSDATPFPGPENHFVKGLADRPGNETTPPV